MDNALADKILKLKKERNATVLAHFYQPLEIQAVADIVGDSLELARKSKETDSDILVFCGVTFMGESASLLCPDKRVLLPAPNAGCAMADTITPDEVIRLKAQHPGSAVVCYINSTAATKAECDICCTSSNAVKVVNSLAVESVIFVPDKNLGRYVERLVPNKRFYFHEKGCCPIHDGLSRDSVLDCKRAHPNAAVIVHPECTYQVCDIADFVGSTAQLLDFCGNSPYDEFIVCTELGVTERMRMLMPEKTFYIPDAKQLYCENMKRISLKDLADTLENLTGEVTIDPKLRERALLPIERMLAL